MKNVLIVDDNKILLESISEYLSTALKDYNVLTAEDGKGAIEVLESNPVSLIMTDLAMPGVDGYCLLSYVKKTFPSIPVIIMTSTWSLDLSSVVREMGCVQYLEKPFGVEEMKQKVIESLGKFENSSIVVAIC